MRRVDVASVLITDDNGRLLLVKNVKDNSSYWGLPGGEVEEGETLEQAAIREAKEETGFTVAITGFHSLREMFFTQRGSHAFIVTFYAKIIDGEMSIHGDPDHDIEEIKWADFETAKELMPILVEKLKMDSGVHEIPAFYAFEGTL